MDKSEPENTLFSGCQQVRRIDPDMGFDLDLSAAFLLEIFVNSWRIHAAHPAPAATHPVYAS